MTLDLPSLEASPTMLVPIHSPAKTNTRRAQTQMSVIDVQAVVETLIRNLPSSTHVPMLQREFATISQRLASLADEDPTEHVINIVSEGILAIADSLSAITQSDQVFKVLATKQTPSSHKTVAHALLLGKSAWGILS